MFSTCFCRHLQIFFFGFENFHKEPNEESTNNLTHSLVGGASSAKYIALIPTGLPPALRPLPPRPRARPAARPAPRQLLEGDAYFPAPPTPPRKVPVWAPMVVEGAPPFLFQALCLPTGSSTGGNSF